MPTRSSYSEPITLTLPPFTRVVKWIIGINLGVYVAFLLANFLPRGQEIQQLAVLLLALIPAKLVHGWLWQAITYAFLHTDLWSVLMNCLGLWFLGSLLESSFGAARFIRFYLICVLGTAVTAIALAYSGVVAAAPAFPVTGAVGAIDGLLGAIGILYAEAEFTLFPLPIRMKAKYLVLITIVIILLFSLQGPGGVLHASELGGLAAGVIYVRFFYSRGRSTVSYAGMYRGRGSDRGFDAKPPKQSFIARWRDSYYRWKRRRAARKFEVYMRKHDREVFFDEHGNYIDPDSPEARNRERGDDRGPWVN